MPQSPNASMLAPGRLLCPMCAARNIFDIDPTEQGELFYCPDCGHQWRYQPPPPEPIGQRPFDRWFNRDPFTPLRD